MQTLRKIAIIYRKSLSVNIALQPMWCLNYCKMQYTAKIQTVNDNYKSKAKLPVVTVTTIHNKFLNILQTLSNWKNITCHLQNEGGLSPSPRNFHTKMTEYYQYKRSKMT